MYSEGRANGISDILDVGCKRKRAVKVDMGCL